MKKFSFNLFSKLPAHEFRITFSTVLTLVRIVLTPCIVIAMIRGWWSFAFAAFVVASLTDLFDGSIARFFNQKTFLGACLDPLADKLLLVSCFATLTYTSALPFVVPLWFVLLVLTREVMIVAGFVYIYYTKTSMDINPKLLGKVTTAAQMTFICWLFACYFYGWTPEKTYSTALAVITLLIITSFLQYARIGWCYYRGIKK